MKVSEIRQRFLDYFESQQHVIVQSASLVPSDDPTLLFTNAGMVPFKNVFLGLEQRPYTRATTAQKCVRAGGKHNDLENVGYTARHHTFFEMLGNFSFGDYFKEAAIQFAWRFLTEELKLPKEKLWITVFKEDKESEDIWFNTIGIDQARFSRCGQKDNFWSMGDTGPCGPCTEIFYDHGDAVAGGPPGSPGEDGDRYIEVWNLVFMQYNRDASGTLTPLPKPCVDTGMGLERISAVIQGVHNNYDIDLFKNLLASIAQITGIKDTRHTSMRVIADHIRSTAFMIADGVSPSNEGRGYVLRRIIRRAVRHGYKLGIKLPFFFRLVEPLVKEMGEHYEELRLQQAHIAAVLKAEEDQFAVTLTRGMKLFEDARAALKDNTLSGEIVFQLYDTYGFPADLTADLAREYNLSIDQAGFEKAMQAQRQRSQSASQFKIDYNQYVKMDSETIFTGYKENNSQARVVALFNNESQVTSLSSGEHGVVVLNQTPFYAESGGQIGDCGKLDCDHGAFVVTDTQKVGRGVIHIGHLESGELAVGDQLTAIVDGRREATKRNHSATHLLHKALKLVLGDHVMQKGSLVDAERLRFDFSHTQAMTDAEKIQVEDLVNAEIRANHMTASQVMSLDNAKASGATALFGEKYDDDVRVVTFGDFSKELCGGTHVQATGDIGAFIITQETAVASGVRRIEALTGQGAIDYIRSQQQTVNRLAVLLKTPSVDLFTRIHQLLEQQKLLEGEIKQLKKAAAGDQLDVLQHQCKRIGEVVILSAKLEEMDVATARDMLDKLRTENHRYAMLIAITQGEKASLIATVSKDLHHQFKAGDLLNHVAQQCDGKGGGRPDLAQGGCLNNNQLDAALASVEPWLANKLAK